MIEFSENLSYRYEGSPAVAQKALYRLSVRAGEIPYFVGGLDIKEFVYGGNITAAVNAALSDFSSDIFVSRDMVSVGDVVINIPGGFS